MYFVTFKDQTEALLDLRSEVNIIKQTFASQLGLKIRKTNFGAQKIDGSTSDAYRIVVSTFSVLDKDRNEMFFEESFQLPDVESDIVFGIHFLTMSNTNIDFQTLDL